MPHADLRTVLALLADGTEWDSPSLRRALGAETLSARTLDEIRRVHGLIECTTPERRSYRRYRITAQGRQWMAAGGPAPKHVVILPAQPRQWWEV